MNKKNRKKIGNYVLCSDELLGEGAVAKVFNCFSASNPEQFYAVKVIEKNKCTPLVNLVNDDDYLK